MKLEAVYEVFRINPFIPVGKKGESPLYALMPVKVYKMMQKELKTKCPPLPANGGIVVCRIIDTEGDNTEIGKGVAVCSLSDKFDSKVGIKLARERAHEKAMKRFGQVRMAVMLGLSDLES